MHEDRTAVRAMLRRAGVVSVDDSGSLQLFNLTGFAGEELSKVLHLQPFGFTSVPPSGGEGLIVCPGGRSDRALFLGGVHPNHRPQNLEAGATAIYDVNGNIISIVQANIRMVHATAISIEAPMVTIKGALTVTKTFNVQNEGGVSSPAQIKGSADFTGDVTAGGISVINHVHGSVMTGSDDTGPAQG